MKRDLSFISRAELVGRSSHIDGSAGQPGPVYLTFTKTRFQNFENEKKITHLLPYFRQNEKKIFQINIEKNGPMARNGVVPETMYGMSRCLWATLESEIGAFVARNIGNTEFFLIPNENDY